MTLLRQATIEVCGLRKKNNRWRKVWKSAQGELRRDIDDRRFELFRTRLNLMYKHVFGDLARQVNERMSFPCWHGVRKEATFVGDTKLIRIDGDDNAMRFRLYGDRLRNDTIDINRHPSFLEPFDDRPFADPNAFTVKP